MDNTTIMYSRLRKRKNTYNTLCTVLQHNSLGILLSSFTIRISVYPCSIAPLTAFLMLLLLRQKGSASGMILQSSRIKLIVFCNRIKCIKHLNLKSASTNEVSKTFSYPWFPLFTLSSANCQISATTNGMYSFYF